MSLDLKKYFSECQQLVDEALEVALPSKEKFPSNVHEAMRYSIFAGGKRIRPILCMAASQACDGGRREVLPIASALEMIHTFSLIHDDLPAMDDDDLRRGVPTSHKVYGEAVAILAGDALLAQAFITLSKLRDSHSEPHRVLEVMADVAEATGSIGMVGGQVLDIDAQGKDIDMDALCKLHQMKTGRLIAVAITGGAKLITNNTVKLDSLERFGESIGLAFQIADDILDIEGGAELGKDIGSDVGNHKATYPALLGLDGAKKAAQKAKEEALGSIENFGAEADPLREIAKFIVERKY